MCIDVTPIPCIKRPSGVSDGNCISRDKIEREIVPSFGNFASI